MIQDSKICVAAKGISSGIQHPDKKVKDVCEYAFAKGVEFAIGLVIESDKIVKDAREAYHRIKSREHSAEDPGNLIANLSKYFDLTGGILSLNDLE